MVFLTEFFLQPQEKKKSNSSSLFEGRAHAHTHTYSRAFIPCVKKKEIESINEMISNTYNSTEWNASLSVFIVGA